LGKKKKAEGWKKLWMFANKVMNKLFIASVDLLLINLEQHYERRVMSGHTFSKLFVKPER
jgi:hypothetical protein